MQPIMKMKDALSKRKAVHDNINSYIFSALTIHKFVYQAGMGMNMESRLISDFSKLVNCVLIRR